MRQAIVLATVWLVLILLVGVWVGCVFGLLLSGHLVWSLLPLVLGLWVVLLLNALT